MCTYEDLVAATLPYGLSPLVVPQLKTITLGGAVSGLGIESASFRNGMPHESVLELDILTGAGEIVTASADQHADLYRAFPNSYGTLGYAVRLRIALEAVQPFVALRHVRYHALTDLVEAMDGIVETGSLDGVRVDYLDGVVFSADESLPVPRSADRRARTGQRLHRAGHLLPVDPARPRDPRGPAHHPRLPVAVGHRLVLVLGRVRRPAPTRTTLLAEALPAQQLLLEAARYRAPVRPGRPVREGSQAAHPGTGRAGHRGADRAVRGVPGLVPGERPHRADLGLSGPAARELVAVSDAARPHLRQPRLLVHGAQRHRRG